MLRIVDVEDGDGGAAGLRAAHEDRAVPLEMPLPRLASGIEETHHVIGQRVAAAQVWSLMEVASVAAPTAVVGIVRAAVLLGEYVFNVEIGPWRGEVGEVAILTPTAGPFADKLAKGLCHQASAERLRSARALAWRMAMKSMVWT